MQFKLTRSDGRGMTTEMEDFSKIIGLDRVAPGQGRGQPCTWLRHRPCLRVQGFQGHPAGHPKHGQGKRPVGR